jgi:hypothetical protein
MGESSRGGVRLHGQGMLCKLEGGGFDNNSTFYQHLSLDRTTNDTRLRSVSHRKLPPRELTFRDIGRSYCNSVYLVANRQVDSCTEHSSWKPNLARSNILLGSTAEVNPMPSKSSFPAFCRPSVGRRHRVQAGENSAVAVSCWFVEV